MSSSGQAIHKLALFFAHDKPKRLPGFARLGTWDNLPLRGLWWRLLM